jgi:hypothetical protein
MFLEVAYMCFQPPTLSIHFTFQNQISNKNISEKNVLFQRENGPDYSHVKDTSFSRFVANVLILFKNIT